MYTVKFPACNINTLGAFRRSFCIISCDVSFGIIHRWCILVCTGNQVLSSCTRFNFPNWWLRCTLTHALSWGIVFQRARCGHWSFSCTGPLPGGGLRLRGDHPWDPHTPISPIQTASGSVCVEPGWFAWGTRRFFDRIPYMDSLCLGFALCICGIVVQALI